MSASFLTVAGRAETAFTVSGSEFLGHVAPAASVTAAESVIEEIEAEHPAATHVVPAYRVPAGTAGAAQSDSVLLREWCSDDGEPGGSAGDPALNVLVQEELRNVVAVVVRYYGGTELGVGGLARAYARAGTSAVDAAGVVETGPPERVDATVGYAGSGTVRGILESTGVEFDADYAAAVSFTVRVPVSDASALRERLRDATSGRVRID